MNLQNDLDQIGEQTTLFSQEGFLANPTAQQENDLAKKMTVTSGQKCLELYERFSRHGSWARMFSALLIGMTGWSSMRCNLTWKLKGTKSNRMYFQLHPLALRTDETEYGLLPTPVASDIEGGISSPTQIHNKNGRFIRKSDTTRTEYGAKLRDVAQLLPTPVASDATTGAIIGKNDTFKMTSGLPRKINQNGTDGSVGLARLVQLIPTPTAVNINKTKQPLYVTKTGTIRSKHVSGKSSQVGLEHQLNYMTGQSGQLNPRFVAEMMGFPPNWTELPFQGGETKA